MGAVKSSLLRGAVAIGALVLSLGASSANAAPEPAPEDENGFVEVPAGCPVPPAADVAFVGKAAAKDFEKVRYEVVQLRAGSITGIAIDGIVDVLYLDDTKFIDVGEEYLIGARFDPDFGALFSTVRPAAPLFGGNDVIGLDDTDTDCPTIDDPVRTVMLDGTSVDSGVISPLLDDKTTLLATVGVPTAIVFAVLIGLVLLRQFWHFFVKGILELGRAAVTPTPDHKSVRVREHREGESTS